jgi:hypothetical protein
VIARYKQQALLFIFNQKFLTGFSLKTVCIMKKKNFSKLSVKKTTLSNFELQFLHEIKGAAGPKTNNRDCTYFPESNCCGQTTIPTVQQNFAG